MSYMTFNLSSDKKATFDQSNPDDHIRRRAGAQETHKKLDNCRVLQRNFDSCVNAAQRGMDPNDRIRHNVPEVPTPELPMVRDLGQFTQDMSNTLLTWSMQLHRLADQLVKDWVSYCFLNF